MKKKLNKKRGFTFIELLAIIVLLALVMIVAFPTVIRSINEAKTKQFQNAANSLAEWMGKQYIIEKSEIGTLNDSYENFVTTATYPNYITEIPETNGEPASSGRKVFTKPIFTAAGIDPDGFTGGSHVWYDINKKKVCVKLSISTSSKLYVSGRDRFVYSNDCP